MLSPGGGVLVPRAWRVFPDHLIRPGFPDENLLTSSDADRGGGWERVRRDRRVEGGPPRPPLRASVNLVPLLWTGVRLHPSA